MKRSEMRQAFGLQADGSLDRRLFLATAGRLGAGLLGMGSAPLLFAQQNPVTVGWVRPGSTSSRMNRRTPPTRCSPCPMWW